MKRNHLSSVSILMLMLLFSCGLTDDPTENNLPDGLVGSYKIVYLAEDFFGPTYMYVKASGSTGVEIIPHLETGHPKFKANVIELTNGKFGLQIDQQTISTGVVVKGTVLSGSEWNGIFDPTDGSIIYFVTLIENGVTQEISVVTNGKTDSSVKCFDQVQSSGEDGVDCGGTCPYTCSETGIIRTLKEASGEEFRSIGFYDDQIGLVYASKTVNPVLYKTVDGGKTWTTINAPAFPIRYITFITESIVYLETDEGVFRSSNGGTTWTLDNTIASSSFNAGFIKKITATKWVVSTQNANGIQYTEDAGASWHEATVNKPGVPEGLNPYDVTHFYSETSGYTFFMGASLKMFLFKTVDSGKTWNLVSSPITGPVNSIHFTDANNGLAVGDFTGVLKTTDGGVTWSLKESENAFCYGVHQNGAIAIASGNWITFSTDNGNTWQSVEGQTIAGYGQMAAFENTVYAITSEAVVKIDLTNLD